jgi:hypothetical protein
MSNLTEEDTIISPADTIINTGITFESPIIANNTPIEEIGELITPAETPVSTVEDVAHQSQQQHHTNQLILKPLHNTGKGPVGNYYAEINWNGGFEQWPLVRFSTPMDGSCLFHAISNSFFAPYHTEQLHGKHVSRTKMVAALRQELAQKLASKISNEPNAPTHYDILNGGNTSAFAEAVPEFALSYMQKQLDSQTPIGYGYMEFIGNALNKDIYILEALRRDIYNTDELHLTIKGDRNSIVLYYMNGHYELVGIQNADGTFDTHFSPEHSFIRFLNNRVKQLTGRN